VAAGVVARKGRTRLAGSVGGQALRARRGRRFDRRVLGALGRCGARASGLDRRLQELLAARAWVQGEAGRERIREGETEGDDGLEES
jgi:hypothetical protein